MQRLPIHRNIDGCIKMPDQQCQCNSSGWCKILNRDMHHDRWDECHNKPHYFEMFLRESEAGWEPDNEKTLFSGPGSELLRLLTFFKWMCNLKDCDCNQRAAEMNKNGPEWCEDNIGAIVDWLKENARKCKMPFSELIARRIVRLAIRRSQKAAINHGCSAASS